jgi:outer membrane receptor for ferrienterochelin and colicins
MEALVRWRQAPYAVTASYLYLDATEPAASGPGRRIVPLTPRHSVGLVAMWEQHDRGRIGLELYCTDEQSVEDNPYRNESEPYLHVGLLGEIVHGRYRLFLNLENLLNVRQTRKDPLVRLARAPDGRWTPGRRWRVL